MTTKSAARTIGTALFVLVLCGNAVAQTPQRPATQTPAAVPLAITELDARTTREQLRELMQRFPPELGRILKMDPSLLRSDTYLAQYPALAAFLTAHPEVAHNPGFYLEFVHVDPDEWTPVDARTEAMRMWRSTLEGVAVFSVFITVAGLIAWFVRTFIDYRRWLRVSHVQTDVHNKLLERFAGTGELLAYIQSPAGRRFLESAPIPLDAGPRSIAAPFGRILWAVQAGVVLTVVGIGFQIVSGRVIDDMGQPLAFIGVLVMALGVGFMLSSVVAYILSRRMGLLDGGTPVAAERQDSSVI